MRHFLLAMIAMFGMIFNAEAQHINHSIAMKSSAEKTYRNPFIFHMEEEDCARTQWREMMYNVSVEHQNGKVFFNGSIRVIAEQPKAFFDVRWGMPHGPTATIGIGYPIRLKKDGCWVLSPALYLHAGNFSGISPGFVMRYEKRKWFVITTNQFLVSIMKNKVTDSYQHHLFSVTTFDYRLVQWLDIGAELEILYGKQKHDSPHHEPVRNNMEYMNHIATNEFWFGPQLRFRIKKNFIEFTGLQNLTQDHTQKFTLTYSREF
jgi:hypothetical protein